MNEIKLSTRDEYHLYINAELNKLKFPPKVKERLRELLRETFDSGIALGQHNLTVRLST